MGMDGGALPAVAHELTVALLVLAGALAAVLAVAAAVAVLIKLGEAVRGGLAARRDARRAEAALRGEVLRGIAALERYLRGHTASS